MVYHTPEMIEQNINIKKKFYYFLICLTQCHMHRNYHLLQHMPSGRQHVILNLLPSLIVFCTYLNQLESSVCAFTMLS